MPKIAITGATGMLGRSVRKALSRVEDAEIIPLGFSRAEGDVRKIDLTSRESINAFFKSEKPDIVIHCAAERRPDVSEKDPDATTRLNVETSSMLAEACKTNDAWLVYISTDYVFDGRTPPYSPDSQTNPLNHYGVTKLAGEKAVLTVSDQFLVLRVPVLFGTVEELGESAVTVIAKVFSNPAPQKIDHWAVRFPTSTDDVASVIVQIIQRNKTHNDLHGTYHWSAEESLTKYEMAVEIGKIWNLDTSFLIADTEEPAGAPRPRNCQLDNSALSNLGIKSHTPFSEAITAAIEPFKPNDHV